MVSDALALFWLFSAVGILAFAMLEDYVPCVVLMAVQWAVWEMFAP